MANSIDVNIVTVGISERGERSQPKGRRSWEKTLFINHPGNNNLTLRLTSESDGADQIGYRVQVHADSAAKGGLVSFFDFIIGLNGMPLQSVLTLSR